MDHDTIGFIRAISDYVGDVIPHAIIQSDHSSGASRNITITWFLVFVTTVFVRIPRLNCRSNFDAV